ncbi:hypothetical protein DVS77_21465 [Mycolicibacterium moriokaense]|nr:hypothetical protein DVS77_21465 [Mycolicibacterium moriokaense]
MSLWDNGQMPKRKSRYVIRRIWSIDRAGYTYQIEEQRKMRDRYHVTLVHRAPTGVDEKAWAEANAKHFGISIKGENDE